MISIGSSFIGMEVANAVAKDNDVTVVGMEKAPLERVMGEQVGRVFQKSLEKNGVKFKMSAGVEQAVPSESDSSKVGGIALKDGTTLPADFVILGTGVGPATTYLKDNKEVELQKDGSLKTDEHFAVSGLKDVYAVGDIATYPYVRIILFFNSSYFGTPFVFLISCPVKGSQTNADITSSTDPAVRDLSPGSSIGTLLKMLAVV